MKTSPIFVTTPHGSRARGFMHSFWREQKRVFFRSIRHRLFIFLKSPNLASANLFFTKYAWV